MGIAEVRAEIARQGGAEDTVAPLVSAELFFEGNRDPASMGCNLSPHPGMALFRDTFLALAKDPQVRAVRVAIFEDMGPDAWPFADTVFVVATFGAAELARRVNRLEATEVLEVSAAEQPSAKPLFPLAPSEHLLMAWWD